MECEHCIECDPECELYPKQQPTHHTEPTKDLIYGTFRSYPDYSEKCYDILVESGGWKYIQSCDSLSEGDGLRVIESLKGLRHPKNWRVVETFTGRIVASRQ